MLTYRNGHSGMQALHPNNVSTLANNFPPGSLEFLAYGFWAEGFRQNHPLSEFHIVNQESDEMCSVYGLLNSESVKEDQKCIFLPEQVAFSYSTNLVAQESQNTWK